jgi:hypothetical protein
VFSAWSLQSYYKEEKNSFEFRDASLRDMSLGAEELNSVESSGLAVAE